MPGGSKSERTKLRIQQAAAKLFASRSFETVSTRAIAKEAGVDAALIHHYFGSKEGLFQAVLNAAIRPEQLEALVVSESPDDWGRQLVRAADKVWTSPAAPALKAVVRPGGPRGRAARIRHTLPVQQIPLPHRRPRTGTTTPGLPDRIPDVRTGDRTPHRRHRTAGKPFRRRSRQPDRARAPALHHGITATWENRRGRKLTPREPRRTWRS